MCAFWLKSVVSRFTQLLFTSLHHFDTLFDPVCLFLSLDVLTLPKSTSAKRRGLVRFVDESTNFLVTSRRTAKRVYSNRRYHNKHNKHQENNGSKWKLGIPTWFWAISHRGRWRQWSLPNSDEGVRSGGTYKSWGAVCYIIPNIPNTIDYLHSQCLLPWTSWTAEQQGLHGEFMSILKLLGTSSFDKCHQATIRPRQQKPNPGAKRRYIFSMY